MSSPTRRVVTDFLKRINSLRVRSPFQGVNLLRDLLRQNADNANLGASIFITTAESTYDLVKGDSYIQATDDCTVNLSTGTDGQTVSIKGLTTLKTITLSPQAPTQLDSKAGDGSVSGVACTTLRYVEEDDNWVIISTQ